MKKITFSMGFLTLALAFCLISAGVYGGQNEALLGTWDVETEDGQFSFAFKFFMEEETLAGTFEGPMGDVAMQNIEFKDNKVTFSFEIDAGGQMMAVDVDGTIDGDTIEGLIAADMGEMGFSGAKRK